MFFVGENLPPDGLQENGPCEDWKAANHDAKLIWQQKEQLLERAVW